MKKTGLIVIICFGFLITQSCRDTKIDTAVTFSCPMGCEEGKTYEAETTCPVCNMVLKKVDDAREHTEHKAHDKDSVHGEH